MTRKGRSKLKTVPKGNSGGGSGLIGSGQFTSAEQIKDQFFAHASSQRAGKESGDAGYWTGGRCNWGGNHNLSEDSQALANFFNSIASIDNDIQQMTLAVNEQEFNNRKQQLVSKLQGCISKCQVTSSTSVGGVCCIWDDFFGSFLKPFLDQFRQKLQSQLNQLQSIQPVHQKEILQLEAEIRAAEAKYQENFKKANQETDPAKKAKFIALANEALDEISKLKKKYSQNPISNLGKFDYLNDLKRLFNGNITPDPPTPPQNNPGPDPTNPGGGNNPLGGGSGPTPWTGDPEDKNNQPTNQQQLLIFAGLALLVILYLYTQKNSDYD